KRQKLDDTLVNEPNEQQTQNCEQSQTGCGQIDETLYKGSMAAENWIIKTENPNEIETGQTINFSPNNPYLAKQNQKDIDLDSQQSSLRPEPEPSMDIVEETTQSENQEHVMQDMETISNGTIEDDVNDIQSIPKPSYSSIINNPRGKQTDPWFDSQEEDEKIVKSRWITNKVNSRTTQFNTVKWDMDTIINTLESANAKQMHIIILGDFNTSLNHRNAKQSDIIRQFQATGLTSLLDFHDITEKPKLIDATDVTNSDHKILLTEISLDLAIKNRRQKLCKKKSYSITESPNKDESEVELNKMWNIWDNLIRATANAHIPYSYTWAKEFHSHSFKATQLYRALKIINSILNTIKKNSWPTSISAFTIQVNKQLKAIEKLTKLELEEICNEDWNTNNYGLTQVKVDKKKQLHAKLQDLYKAKPLKTKQKLTPNINSKDHITVKLCEAFSEAQPLLWIKMEEVPEVLQVENATWPSIKKLSITALLIIWTLAPNWATINITTNDNNIQQIMTEIENTPPI
ncbi:3147_t:CDS:2, partial [Gigaspora rosea]